MTTALASVRRREARQQPAATRSRGYEGFPASHTQATASRLALLGGTLLATYAFAIRPWHVRWGATDAEIALPMPGDDLVPSPGYVTNRAITIYARPAQIWPWLAQMGEAPRGGFYSYTTVERALGMHVVNASSLLPGYGHLAVGDTLDRAGNMVVKALAYEEYLVLGPPAGTPWGMSTWAIVLLPVDDERTRLVSRVRARVDQWTPQMLGWLLLLDPGQFLMERKWLLGLKQRAEATAGHGAPSAGAPPILFRGRG